MTPPLTTLQAAPLPTAAPPSLTPTPVSVAPGDGIGPEILAATLEVLEAAGARLALEEVALGKAVAERGVSSGITDAAWDSIRRTRLLLKGPITTPQGQGYKSVNVTLRKSLGLFANVRPCQSFPPHAGRGDQAVDLIVVRENEEDVYGAIEHRQTEDVTQCLKLITRSGSERVIRYAFELARRAGRRRVTCMTKDNILKVTDGLFRQVFEEVARDYPELTADHQIIDIGTARLAARPTDYDLIVTPNLYGDILSDVGAEVTGSVGMAPSANVGLSCAMFEAVHGSAPDIAGQDLANPSGLLLAAALLLEHVGQGEVAERIQNAWRVTIERGIHTADLYRAATSRTRVGTRGFAAAVIDHLGAVPQLLPPAPRRPSGGLSLAPPAPTRRKSRKTLHGVDVFLDWTGAPQHLGAALEPLGQADLPLRLITNRGVQVWPKGFPETTCVDHWRCRFLAAADQEVEPSAILDLLERLQAAGFDVIKTERLFAFDGVYGFSRGQGE